MFSNWVTAGGNLIAMRPDKQLARLLGLTDAGHDARPTRYLQVQTRLGAGAGIVGETMQFHGTADRYALERRQRRRDAVLDARPAPPRVRR